MVSFEFSDSGPAARQEERDVTRLLARVHEGDRGAWEELLLDVQAELHALAHRRMAGERPGHLLQTTALVNEAFLRLVRDESARISGRAEFFSAAASAMRRILVEDARRRKAQKRDGGGTPARVSQIAESTPAREGEPDLAEDIEALDRALRAFETDGAHEKKSRIVELRYFAGLTIEETAETLGTSIATVKRDWEFARAWLRRELNRAAHGT